MPEYRIIVVDTYDGEILRDITRAILWDMEAGEIKCRKYKTLKWAQKRWPMRGNRLSVEVYKIT